MVMSQQLFDMLLDFNGPGYRSAKDGSRSDARQTGQSDEKQDGNDWCHISTLLLI